MKGSRIKGFKGLSAEDQEGLRRPASGFSVAPVTSHQSRGTSICPSAPQILDPSTYDFFVSWSLGSKNSTYGRQGLTCIFHHQAGMRGAQQVGIERAYLPYSDRVPAVREADTLRTRRAQRAGSHYRADQNADWEMMRSTKYERRKSGQEDTKARRTPLHCSCLDFGRFDFLASCLGAFVAKKSKIRIPKSAMGMLATRYRLLTTISRS